MFPNRNLTVEVSVGGQADQKNLSASNELKQAFFVYSPGGLEAEREKRLPSAMDQGSPHTLEPRFHPGTGRWRRERALMVDQEWLSGCFRKRPDPGIWGEPDRRPLCQAVCNQAAIVDWKFTVRVVTVTGNGSVWDPLVTHRIPPFHVCWSGRPL